MGYTLVKELTTVNYTAMSNKNNKYIVIHYTGNKTDKAKSNANYFKSTHRGASAHYFVDDTSVYQVVEDKNASWAVGKNYGSNNLFGVVTNANSISIEMCSTNGKITDGTFNNTVDLTKSLMKKYNITASHVYRHYDICSKSCPGWTGWIGSNQTIWNHFKACIMSDNVKTQTKEEIKMAKVFLYTLDGGDKQKWNPQLVNGKYMLKNKYSGEYLDVVGGSTKSGTEVQTYKKNGSTAQQWSIEQLKGSYNPTCVAPFTIVSALNKSLVLDVKDGAKTNNSPLDIYTFNNTGAQKFSIIDSGDGYWCIVNVNSMKALSV